MPTPKKLFSLFKLTYQEWHTDHATRLAAALAYYTVFSIAPLLIVVIAVASVAFGQEAVRGRLDEQIQSLVGREGADMIQQMIQNTMKPSESILATTIGVITLFLGAGGVFGQLQDALNTIWGVKPKKESSIIRTIRKRFLSFTMVLGVGFILLVSLVLSAALAALDEFLVGLMPSMALLLQIGNMAFSFFIISILFAMIYKVLPDLDIKWRDVWVGAIFTTLLFVIGKFVIGLYLGRSSVTSTYGAAGSLVVILLWIFYSAQIFLFGAEFTQVYANNYGSHPAPIEAVPVVVKEEVQTGGKKPIRPTPLPNAPIRVASAKTPPPHKHWLTPVFAVLTAGSMAVSFIIGREMGKEEHPPEL